MRWERAGGQIDDTAGAVVAKETKGAPPWNFEVARGRERVDAPQHLRADRGRARLARRDGYGGETSWACQLSPIVMVRVYWPVAPSRANCTDTSFTTAPSSP